MKSYSNRGVNVNGKLSNRETKAFRQLNIVISSSVYFPEKYF